MATISLARRARRVKRGWRYINPMIRTPPLPYLTGEPIPDPEETPPVAGAPALHRLQYFIFRVPREPRTSREIIHWWEKRHLAYNLIIGTFGVPLYVAAAMAARGAAGVPYYILAPIILGIMANIGYCGGWVAEIIF